MKLLTMLFVDDDDDKYVEFLRRQHKGHDNIIIRAFNYSDAIEKLQDADYDIIWMDNDLGDTKEGYHIIQYVLENDLYQNTTFIIHSMNPVAGKLMGRMLKQRGYRVFYKPGAWKKVKFSADNILSFDSTW